MLPLVRTSSLYPPPVFAIWSGHGCSPDQDLMMRRDALRSLTILNVSQFSGRRRSSRDVWIIHTG